MDMFHVLRKYYFSNLKQCHLCKLSASSYSTSIPKNQILAKNLNVLQAKVYNVMKWYEQFTGIDEIRTAQNKVIEAQDRFAAAQEKRREVTLELNELGSKIKDIQEELSGTSRGEEKYITLITKEHKLLKEEIRLTDKLNLYEREERELFTTLSSAVKDSHEKERIQANKTKYLSIIGSVVGALIGITGSTLNNRSKLSEIRKMVMQSTEVNKQELLTVLQQHESSVRTNASDSINQEKIYEKLQKILETLTKIQAELSKTAVMEQSLARIEKKLVSSLASSSTAAPLEDIENFDDPDTVFSFTNIKDDITYALMSCVSIYVLYKMFFF